MGLYKTGLTEVDKQQSYASLKTVQRFLKVPASYLTDIKIKLYDKELVPKVSEEFQRKYSYYGSDWKKVNSSLLKGVFYAR